MVVNSEAAERYFQPTMGYLQAKDLDTNFHRRVDSIEIVVKDALEGSPAHSDAEQWVYDWANTLHIESKPWTIKRRLLFSKGDTTSAQTLRESEKNLRSEDFLADAYIEAKPLGDSACIIRVTSYDQWTITPGVSLNRAGGKWVWWLGLAESNLLGTGQRVGYFYGSDLLRETHWLDYSNRAFTPFNVSLAGNYSWHSDGYSYLMSMGKPLRSRNDRWGFSFSFSGSELAEYFYLSANELEAVEKTNVLSEDSQKWLNSTTTLGRWKSIGSHRTYAAVTRSFGSKLKFSMSPYYNRFDRYRNGTFGYYTEYAPLLPFLETPGEPELYLRHDEEFGLSFSLYQYDYKTVHNFRNLKWSESLETGWRLTLAAGQNQEWLGAKNDETWHSYSAVWNNAYADRIFLNTSASLGHWMTSNGELDDGSTSAALEGQWKPITLTSTVFSMNWNSLFATEQSRQLTMGDESGLSGYPNFYYSGKARFLLGLEQRLFPAWEVGTVVPALAVFFNAGNTWQDPEQTDFSDLHYSVGFGLRLGATRSVQKVVNHLNFSFPLGEDNVGAFQFGLKASKSL